MKSLLTIFVLLLAVSTVRASDNPTSMPSEVSLNDRVSLSVEGVKVGGHVVNSATALLARQEAVMDTFPLVDSAGVETHNIFVLGQDIRQGKVFSTSYAVKATNESKEMIYRVFASSKCLSIEDVSHVSEKFSSIINVQCYHSSQE